MKELTFSLFKSCGEETRKSPSVTSGIQERRGGGSELRRKGNEGRRGRRTERGEGRDLNAHEYYNDSHIIFDTIGTSQYGQDV